MPARWFLGFGTSGLRNARLAGKRPGQCCGKADCSATARRSGPTSSSSTTTVPAAARVPITTSGPSLKTSPTTPASTSEERASKLPDEHANAARQSHRAWHAVRLRDVEGTGHRNPESVATPPLRVRGPVVWRLVRRARRVEERAVRATPRWSRPPWAHHLPAIATHEPCCLRFVAQLHCASNSSPLAPDGVGSVTHHPFVTTDLAGD